MHVQVVFWDMRGPFLEALYKHHVRQARLAPVLDGLDTALSQLCAASVPDVHPLLAQGLLHASTNGLLRVLLHGGPDRSAPAPLHAALGAVRSLATTSEPQFGGQSAGLVKG